MRAGRRASFPHLLASGLLLMGALLAGAGCGRRPPASIEGYIAARYVHVAAPVSGRLASLAVSRGAPVEEGRALFALASLPEADAVAEASAQSDAAAAALADLQTGARPGEIESLGHVSKALQAARTYATLELQRSQRLYQTKVVSEEDLNRNQSAELFFQELVKAVDSYTALVGLPARDAKIAQAAAQARAAGFALKQATWQLEQKCQPAPAAGVVFDTFYLPGEWVPAGAPVVSILPPGEIVARFYVDEEALAAFPPGADATVQSGGKSARGTVRYVSPEAAYSPPMIYSRENPSRLVFLVEIGFAAEDAKGFHPGQPAQVAPAGR